MGSLIEGLGDLLGLEVALRSDCCRSAPLGGPGHLIPVTEHVLDELGLPRRLVGDVLLLGEGGGVHATAVQ